MKKFSELLAEAKKIPNIQYHSTPWENLDSILKTGLVVPKSKKAITTHNYKVRTISTANEPEFAQVYNPDGALLKITLDHSKYKFVDLNKEWKKGESLEEVVDTLIKKYKKEGFDGIYVGDNFQSTVGNQTYDTIPPECIELVNSPAESLETIKESIEIKIDTALDKFSGKELFPESNKRARELLKNVVFLKESEDDKKSDEHKEDPLTLAFNKLSDLLSREYTYTDKVRDKLIDLITEQYDAVMDEVKGLFKTSDEVKELVNKLEKEKKRPSLCAEIIFDKIYSKPISEGKKKEKGFENVSKPKELVSKMKKQGLEKALEGVSLGKDEKGFFVYTHRARSKSYEQAENIPGKDVRFIESTG